MTTHVGRVTALSLPDITPDIHTPRYVGHEKRAPNLRNSKELLCLKITCRADTETKSDKKALTHARLLECLHYDPDTGVFTRLIAPGSRTDLIGKIAGHRNTTGYTKIWVDAHLYLAHRLAWLYVTGAWPTGLIDHEKGVLAGDMFSNLREVSCNGNAHNVRTASKNSKTGLLGTRYHTPSRRYTAQIGVDRKTKYLGSFDTAEEAHQAYLEAKRILHPTCTI